LTASSGDVTMTTWNYRVAKNTHGEIVIVEVYYDEDGNVEFWSAEQFPLGEDVDDLRKDLQHMLEALDKPLFEKVIEEGE
jgi:hypothetical protein